MPRKKSIKRTAAQFEEHVGQIETFTASARAANLGAEHLSFVYDFAIIRLYREVEELMLNALVGAINNDTSTVSDAIEVALPKHLTDEVCEFLVVGRGYFDFKGRDGLIGELRNFLPKDHALVAIVKKDKYEAPLNMLVALRNFAAHGSTKAKAKALASVGQERMGSSGAWLKRQGRFEGLVEAIKELAVEIGAWAPY